MIYHVSERQIYFFSHVSQMIRRTFNASVELIECPGNICRDFREPGWNGRLPMAEQIHTKNRFDDWKKIDPTTLYIEFFH